MIIFRTFEKTNPFTRELRILVSIWLLQDLPFFLTMTGSGGLLIMPIQKTVLSLIALDSHLPILILRFFVKNYALKPFRQLLNADFVKDAKSRYNFDEMFKYWMNEPCNFYWRKYDLYPIEWLKEPYSMLDEILCRLYGLPNDSYFKEECASIAHHVINTRESLPWASILSLVLKTTIQYFQKATAMKKPNFFFFAYIVDIFCVELHYPNLGWN